MNYLDITKKINVKNYLNNIKEKCVIFYSPTSVNKNDINLDKENFQCFSTNDIRNVVEQLDSLVEKVDPFDLIISIGGGTAIDIGKYFSYKTNKRLVCIPGMLSTNAYSTNKVALYVNGKKETLDSVLPSEILFDENLLNNSSENNVYGMADIFSIYTALNDWDLSIKYNNEKKSEEYDQAKDLLESVIDYTLNNEFSYLVKDAFFIYKKIGESGEITNKYGCGKPESGSEHIFAKALEKEISVPHAVSVANGILLMSIAQSLFTGNELDKRPYLSLKKLNIYSLNKKYGVTSELVRKIFMHLSPREDRFTIVNLIEDDLDLKIKIFDKYSKIITDMENNSDNS